MGYFTKKIAASVPAPVQPTPAAPVDVAPTPTAPSAPVPQPSGWQSPGSQFAAPNIGDIAKSIIDPASSPLNPLNQAQTTFDVIKGATGGSAANPNAAYYGGAYDPNYKPSLAEQAGNMVGAPIRAAGEALNAFGGQAVDAYNAAKDIATGNYSSTDTAAGAAMVKKSQEGFKTTLTKFSAGATEAALNIFTAGEVGSVFGAGKEVVQLTGEQTAKQLLKESPEIASNIPSIVSGAKVTFAQKAAKAAFWLGQKPAEGAMFGGVYGALGGLQTYPNDWMKAMESAKEGAVAGAILMPALDGLVMLGAAGISGVLSRVDALGGKMIDVAPHQILNPRAGYEKFARAVDRTNNPSLAADIRAIPGQIDTYRAEIAVKKAAVMRNMEEIGQISPVRKELGGGTAKALGTDTGKYLAAGGGGDEEAMMKGMAAHEQLTKIYKKGDIVNPAEDFKNPKVAAAHIAANPVLKNTDTQRVVYGATSQIKNVWDGKVMVAGKEMPYNPAKYAPHDIPVVELSPATKSALAKTSDNAEKLAILDKNDPKIERAIRYSVDYRGDFPDKLTSHLTYNDFVDFVRDRKLGEAPPIPDNKNKFLQWLATNDKYPDIKTPADAADILRAQESNRKMALTTRASSLDYHRSIDIPWYNTNIAEVMHNYTNDAIDRIHGADLFGPNDQKLLKTINAVGDLKHTGKKGALELKTGLEAVTRKALETTPADKSVAGKISRWATAVQNLKLGTSQLKILGEGFSGAMVTDMGSWLKGIGKAFTDKGISDAYDAGVLLNSYKKQALNFAHGNESLLNKSMTYTGMSNIDLFKRVTTANNVTDYIEKAFNQLAKEADVPLGNAAKGEEMAALAAKRDQEVAQEFSKLRVKDPEGDIAAQHQAAMDKVMGPTPVALDVTPPKFTKSKKNPLKALQDVINGKPDISPSKAATPNPYSVLAEHDQGIATNKAAIADKMAQIEKNKSDAYHVLNDAHVDIHDALAKGYLSKEDKAIAAYRGTEKILAGNPQDMPFFADSWYGRMMTQFKKYGYNQAQLGLSTLKTQLERGQHGKALTTLGYMIALIPAQNAVMNDIKSLATGQKVPTTALDQYVGAFFDSSSQALLSDFLGEAEKGNVLDFIAGPSFGDAQKYIEAVTGDVADIVGTAFSAATGNKVGTKKGMNSLMTDVGNAKDMALGATGLSSIAKGYLGPKKQVAGQDSMLNIVTGKSKQNFFTGKRK